jgi:ketopantoate reductase
MASRSPTSTVAGAQLPAAGLRLCEQVPVGARPALVLLCVKSGATAEAAGELAFALPAGTTVVSLQNGISNCAVASQAGPSLQVLPGMVPYNVAEIDAGAFHRGTPGRLAAGDDAALRPWLPVFERAGVPLDLHADLLSVQWGKLLLNLNNPVNALSGLPLREELMQRGYRRCFAALIDEALGVLAVAASRRPRWRPFRRSACRACCGCPTGCFASSRRACCASTPRRVPAWPTTWRWAAAPRSMRSAARSCGWRKSTA